MQFTDLSEPKGGIDKWSWSFGDGDTSSIQNPSHTYKSDGLFTVKLTVSNVSGSDTETKNNLIFVEPTPEPPVLFKLTVTPTTAKRFSFETATVTALDQNNEPMSGVRVDVSTSNGAIIFPKSSTTDTNGKAKFLFQFLSKNGGNITFTADGKSATITQK